jgi:tripartite-type tricarboxylate transporter receptor subunit TctC
MPHVKSGRLKALAVTSAHSSALLPDLPAIADSGLPGYESVAMVAVFAPAKTPDAIIKRLNQESVRFLNSPEVKQRFLNAGAETVGSSPAELTATLKSEMNRIGKVIRNAGIRDE